MKSPAVCLFDGFGRNLTALFASLFAFLPAQTPGCPGKPMQSDISRFLAFVAQIPTVPATI
ncbi:MAG: hypothetical protein WC661_14695 [Opitutaceae bacterium]|jgi:hypothetical protein